MNRRNLKYCSHCDSYFPKTKKYWKRSVHGKLLDKCLRCRPTKKKRRMFVTPVAEKKQYILSIKEVGKCKTCPEDRTEVLQFHHRDPDEKVFALSKASSHTMEEIKGEIKKCDILCANCHISLHYWENQPT